MTAWDDHLARLERRLDRAEQHLLAGDLDAASTEIAALPDGRGAGLPPLPGGSADRARRAVERLAAVEAATVATLHRLRPELALVTGAGSRPTGALFVDQTA